MMTLLMIGIRFTTIGTIGIYNQKVDLDIIRCCIRLQQLMKHQLMTDNETTGKLTGDTGYD